MYEEILVSQPSTTFPHLLTLNAVPYTIMNVFSKSEKHELLGANNTNTSTPVVNAFTGLKMLFI